MVAPDLRWEIREGDCIDLMAAMPEASVDAVVCDPPYLIGFMGKEFDSQHKTFVERKSVRRCGSFESVQGNHNPINSMDQQRTRLVEGHRAQAWHEAWVREALRVLKPGGHLLAFGGTRTYHRLACAVEDAGFEIRDTIMWLYGSGFPKSLDVSKAIDKAAGAEREVVGINEDYLRRKPNGMQTPGATTYAYSERQQETDARITAPATCNAEQWDGWGTALKPAHEPIVVARKPLVGTVVANVLALGTGSMNIDGCRIGTATDSERGEGRGGEADPRVPRGRIGEASADRRYTERGATRFTLTPGPRGGDVAGRWPTNVVLDEDAAGMLDEQTGMLTSGKSDGFVGEYTANVYGKYARNEIRPETVYGDTGGASRFYYCAKASSAERSVGLSNGERSSHPTVKPIDLMRWLVRLVTPPGGLVLDPFAGSGTTGIAAVLEGFRFVGMEREPDYARIARARIAWWAENPQGLATDAILAAATERPDASQLDLFSV